MKKMFLLAFLLIVAGGFAMDVLSLDLEICLYENATDQVVDNVNISITGAMVFEQDNQSAFSAGPISKMQTGIGKKFRAYATNQNNEIICDTEFWPESNLFVASTIYRLDDCLTTSASFSSAKNIENISISMGDQMLLHLTNLQTKLCNHNNVCEWNPEKKQLENHLTCRDDCLPGGCGDGYCDSSQQEAYDYCPEDCPSGSLDGFCDGVKDGKFDFDCDPSEDPDCVGNEQWCLNEFYSTIRTPPPSETIVTYSFSGNDMHVQLSKPAEGELPPEAKPILISDTKNMFKTLNLTANKINVDIINGNLVISIVVQKIANNNFTFTPIPEYKTVVTGFKEISPTPDLLEGGTATYDIPPNRITVILETPEPGIDWLIVFMVLVMAVIVVWLIKKR